MTASARAPTTTAGSPAVREEGTGRVDGPVIEAWQLAKSFRDVAAVRGVSFTVPRGEVFGFFGPNGAGKSTTIRLLRGPTAPTTGSAIVCGMDVDRQPIAGRRFLGILPEETTFYERE